MTVHEVEEGRAHIAKLLLERQAAIELYQAVRVGAGETLTKAAEQGKIEAPYRIVVRKRTAIELVDALGLPLGFAPAPKGKDDEKTEEEFVQLVIGTPTAAMLLNALTISLGEEPSSKAKDENVVEIVLNKFTAVDLLNALIVNFSTLADRKKGKNAGKMKGKT